MTSDWREFSIDELKGTGKSALAIGPFGSRMKSDCYVDDGVPVIRGNNLNGTRYLTGDFVYVSEEKANELSSCTVRENDLVFPHRGSIGEVGIVPGDRERYILSTSLMKLTVNTAFVEPLFLFYYFRSEMGRHELLKNASQVGTPGIATPLTSLKNILLTLPSLNEQQEITRHLGMIEEKIELNRQMNVTLEAIAQAFFKSWFVDFDPVKAKAEGRMPEGMGANTAALFPDRFEDSELGEIPAGWSTGSILTQARLLSGGTPKTEHPDYWNGNIRWASAKDVSQARQTFLVTTERTITSKGLEESATQLIPALATVIVARGATTGRMVLFGQEMAMNQTCYALVSLTETPFALHCRLRQAIDALVHAAHGSVFDTITTSTFLTSKMVLPPANPLQVFERIVSPIFGRILTATEECLTLATLRDALLPKLISGQLRIPEAEKMAEAAR